MEILDDEFVMVPVTTILNDTTGSVDFGFVSDFGSSEAFWREIIINKSSDTGFGHLVESIMEDGWSEDSAIGWDGDYITEGHHRLVAAILLGMDEVPVSLYGTSQWRGNGYICAHSNLADPYPIELV